MYVWHGLRGIGKDVDFGTPLLGVRRPPVTIGMGGGRV